MPYPGLWGAPSDPRDGMEPIVLAQSITGPRPLRWSSYLTGNTPLGTIQNQADGGKSYQHITGPSRWLGPYSGIGRQFLPKLGAYAGTTSGGWQQNNFNLPLPPPVIPRVYMLARSLRSITQKFNGNAATQGIPSVFVPTSASNFYGQLGSS